MNKIVRHKILTIFHKNISNRVVTYQLNYSLAFTQYILDHLLVRTYTRKFEQEVGNFVLFTYKMQKLFHALCW